MRFSRQLIILGFVIAFLFLGWLGFSYYNGSNPTFVTVENLSPVNTQIIIENNFDSSKYITNSRFFETILSQVSQPLSEYVVRITDDTATPTYHHYWDGEKISGISTTYSENRGTITIYLNPSLDNDRHLYEINNHFINGLFFIDLEKSTPANTEINYAAAADRANDVFMKLQETDKLPINIQ